MNRLIKFRAWDFEKNIMLDNHDDDGWLSGTHFFLEPSFESINTKFAWMQYTGLHDKNGTEIYEGDIVLIDFDVDEEPTKSVVEYKSGGFVVEADFGDFDMTTIGWALDITDSITVIGNIYENPELLKP